MSALQPKERNMAVDEENKPLNKPSKIVMSRRNLLRGAAAGAGIALACSPRNSLAHTIAPIPSTGAEKLKMTLACWDYDRTTALAIGSVSPEGIDLTFLSLPPEETFFRMLRYHEFDAAEMSLSSYVVSLSQENPQFIAKGGVREPKDLVGRRIGIPEYQMTAAVWIRGIMSDDYGVAPTAVEYRTGGEEQTGRDEKIALDLPPEFKVRPIGPNQTLSKMLADGELDALYTARIPSTFVARPKDVRRLFENYVEIERAYYRKTKIFPIMHTVVIRRDIYLAHPWTAQSLYKAFSESQRRIYEGIQDTAALKVMLPWLRSHVEELWREMGMDWWPYGFQSNRHVLETFLRYHYEQGLSKRRLRPEELFAPETLEAFKI
jgi:4,5-dihydroxyphthalate decarboxylase